MTVQVNLYEAKTRLSQLVDQAAAGELVIIAKNGVPMARLTAIAAKQETPRKLGLEEGMTFVTRNAALAGYAKCGLRILPA